MKPIYDRHNERRACLPKHENAYMKMSFMSTNEAKLIETKIGACLKIPRSRTKKNVTRHTTKTKMNYGLTCFETRLARPACPARYPATVVPGHGVLVLDWHCRRFLTFLIVSRWLLFLVVCSGRRRPSPNSRFHLKRHNSKFTNTNTCTSCDFILAQKWREQLPRISCPFDFAVS